ncbi:MAG: DUF4349 domain-containing protein [Clostridiales bacterium]|nr:DUF4349 domain-containing protein [Clostridiales bacterium]
MKKSKIIIIVTAAFLSLVLFIGGLAAIGAALSSSSSSARRTNDKNNTAEATAAANEIAYALDEPAVEYNADMADAEYYSEEYYLNGDAGYDLISADVSPEGINVADTSSKLIRTVNMSIETELFDDMDSAIKNRINEYGGYFESMSVTGTGKNENYRYGYYTIRIPAANLDAFIASINGNGTIISQSESTVDVTLDYVDMEAHIESLRTEQEALQGMLAEATELETIIILQDELSSVSYEIESYESQIRTMDNQVSYSTLYLTVNEVVTETPVVETRTMTYGEKLSESFLGSVNKIKEDCKAGIIGLAAALPHLIILAFFVLIAFIIIKITIRRAKKKKALKAAKVSA